MSFFRLKSVRAARVSEVSETTAAAPVPDEARINFHIGNPLQDSRLSSGFLRIVLGLDIHQEELQDSEPETLLDHLGWDEVDKPKLEFLIRTIRKSAPYMPRGGYSTKAPHALIHLFYDWLEHQQETLHYDNGQRSGKREVILATGGLQETLRVILFTLSGRLSHLPARILCYDFDLTPANLSIPNLLFENLPTNEALAYQRIEEVVSAQPPAPTFLLLGSVPDETMRRKLRRLSVDRPLFFIEANNAPNHLSLAREARLVQIVIRLLTPAIFAPQLATQPTVFVAGNAEFLRAIESVHFNLKGTPSASEVEFLTFLLQQEAITPSKNSPSALPQTKPPIEGLRVGDETFTALPRLMERTGQHLEKLQTAQARILGHSLETLEQKTTLFSQRIQGWWKTQAFDEFASIGAEKILELSINNLDQPGFSAALERSFLSAFVKHQPQYQPESCVVVSGSSRTALGILGFHCGITEVVIPDLSWSYEQCFPQIHVVALTKDLKLDARAMIEKVEELCRRDPSWSRRGAMVINNPHNATGRVFDEDAVKKLIIYCLENNIYFIDDLAYQNMAPVDDLPEIKSLRQLTEELVWLGMVDGHRADRVISVHTVSKTDCSAGSRLAVAEIRDRQLRQRFEAVKDQIQPNIAAILISYLFYRRDVQTVRTYWHLRNVILADRSNALMSAVENLPDERNPFGLEIIPPAGSMYPLLHVENLPAGLSLDWLSSSLARRGIGMLPLATFARTESGFEAGRTTFRLTLGGVDGAQTIRAKARRLLIDLNRLIADETARYNRHQLSFRKPNDTGTRQSELTHAMDVITEQILQYASNDRASRRLMASPLLDTGRAQRDFVRTYAPERLAIFRTRLLDRALIESELTRRARDDGGQWFAEKLQREFMKDSLERRQGRFKLRAYDRTVHPTQMYSLQAELALDAILATLIAGNRVTPAHIDRAAQELLKEYLGLNIRISSQQESSEILLDLDALTASEDYMDLFTNTTVMPFLSFWSDWDGSTRPSGQGHYLVASVVMENVRRMARILNILRQVDNTISLEPDLVSELEQLDQRTRRFERLLSDITQLTHQLEQRYRGILPYSLDRTPLQRMATRLHLRRDPAKVLWQHNDRYEKRMFELRRERREALEHYFSLNKQLRKQLHALIPAILMNRTVEPLMREVVCYQDILQRVVITPRIQESMITARDPFAVDTTVSNVHEINTISGKYGNPGMVLAMQISLSTEPETLIALDRKMHTQLEQSRREHPASSLPNIWLIPLFESSESVDNIRSYLDQIWGYATQSRQTAQATQDRFAEIITEVFIAGSDLSQQVSQARSAFLYRKAQYDVLSWLVEQDTSDHVRLKLGSGEPMQRQGSYYSRVAGAHAFLNTAANRHRYAEYLPAAARKSTLYAVTPLQGVFRGGELRTFQSNLSEQLRFLPARDFASLLYHVREAQAIHREDLIRAVEAAGESRLIEPSRSLQELEQLTIGIKQTLYEDFLLELTESFRHILYGEEEDVIGLHVISYFIGRSMPQFRDRPTSRRTGGTGAERGQRILTNIAEIIPLAKQGSLLRAISHNKSQTAVLGVNQLTTGLFRALERFAQKAFVEAEQERMIAERLLPHLPVYEILSTLRVYQDSEEEFLQTVETAFPAGNSSFVALREDRDALQRYLPLFQQELLRRHGIDVNQFFSNGVFIPQLLPTLRPDLVVLVQRNLFNTDIDTLLEQITGKVADDWLAEVTRLLEVPRQIRYWRSIIWDILGESIYERVQRFAELATTLYAFVSTNNHADAAPLVTRGAKLSPEFAGFFRSAPVNDEMRNFLLGAIEYLSTFAEGNREMPVSIIRAMNNVERIAHIEESALPPETQDLFRFCILQIARLAGDNG